MEPIIGLEVHVELNTAHKMFCRCSAQWFGKKPNSHVCPVCLGLPGALPVPNREAIDWTVRIALALHCSINTHSYFERKHYFYPDLPKGYQISQYKQPLGYGGYLEVPYNGKVVRVEIERVHLEEDTGKLSYKKHALVDFNRSGVPLVEIVTKPVIHDPELTTAYLKHLRLTILHLGVSDVDMEKGSMRCEPNISLRKAGEKALPSYKVEVKNINSFRFVKKAIQHELVRQEALLKKGERPMQETRRYVESTGKTARTRNKEEARDYRYMPEPDIPPVILTEKDIAREKNILEKTDTLEKRRTRLAKLGASEEEIQYLIEHKDKAQLILETVKEYKIPSRSAITVVMNLSDPKKTTPRQLSKEISAKLAPKEFDKGLLDEVLNKALADNPKAVSDYKAGNESALHVLMGAAMRATKRNANASEVHNALVKKLS